MSLYHLQRTINGRQVRGIVGEFSDNSPKSGRAYLVYANSNSVQPTFGRFFSFYEKATSTGSSAKSTVAIIGADSNSWAMGILVNPKEHYTNGFVTSTTIADGAVGTIATRGHIFVEAATTTVAGGDVYTNANGELGNGTLSGGKKVVGAKWLRTVKASDGKAFSEVAIDNPTVTDCAGGSSIA